MVGGGNCRLQMPSKLALGARGTWLGIGWASWSGGGGVTSPPSPSWGVPSARPSSPPPWALALAPSPLAWGPSWEGEEEGGGGVGGHVGRVGRGLHLLLRGLEPLFLLATLVVGLIGAVWGLVLMEGSFWGWMAADTRHHPFFLCVKFLCL